MILSDEPVSSGSTGPVCPHAYMDWPMHQHKTSAVSFPRKKHEESCVCVCVFNSPSRWPTWDSCIDEALPSFPSPTTPTKLEANAKNSQTLLFKEARK